MNDVEENSVLMSMLYMMDCVQTVMKQSKMKKIWKRMTRMGVSLGTSRFHTFNLPRGTLLETSSSTSLANSVLNPTETFFSS